MSKNNNALATVLTPASLATELDGFAFVPADGMPAITIDKERRFYFNASARKMFGLKPYGRIAIGYNAEKQALAIVTKNVDALPGNYIFVLDKRCYAYARRMIKDYRIPVEEAPIRYRFVTSASVDGVFIFQRER